MVNYANGKIYKIISDQTDKIYIGSTTKQYLSQRMEEHRSTYQRYLKGFSDNYVASFELLKYDDAKIILLKVLPCNSKDELTTEEQIFIDIFRDTAVNKRNAFGVNINNRKELKMKYNKNYNDTNKESIVEKKKQYYEANKQAIIQKHKTKYTCECGACITIGSKARHERTANHQMLMQIKDNSNAQ